MASRGKMAGRFSRGKKTVHRLVLWVGHRFLASGNADKGQEQRNTYPITPVAGIVALALRDKVLHHGVDGFGIALALALGGRPWWWRYLEGNLLCKAVLWLVGWIGGCSDVEAKGWMVDCGSLVGPSVLWRQASLVGVGFFTMVRSMPPQGCKRVRVVFSSLLPPSPVSILCCLFRILLISCLHV